MTLFPTSFLYIIMFTVVHKLLRVALVIIVLCDIEMYILFAGNIIAFGITLKIVFP